MPYTDRLPFSGITPQSRYSSWLGAKAAEPRAGSQSAKYLALLQAHPEGLTDWQSADLMGIERSTINARRAGLVRDGKVYSDGFRKNADSGIRNTVWKAR